jgi:hypothetical protein
LTALLPAQFTALHGFIPVNLGLAGMLAIGLAMRDRFARALRAVGAVGMAVMLTAAFYSPSHASFMLEACYFMGLVTVSIICWRVLRNPLFITAPVSAIVIALTQFIQPLHAPVKHLVAVPGMSAIFWGVVFFLIALALSLLKSNAVRARLRRWMQPSLNPRTNGANAEGRVDHV